MRLAVVLAFAAYLACGVAIHGDYGLSWDEGISRQLGKRTYEFVAARASGQNVSWAGLSAGVVAEYGPFFETVLYAGERALGIDDIADSFRWRHLATFVAFWLGSLAFYALVRMRTDDRLLALTATAIFVMTPRLFAHSFYNSKDSVLAAVFAAATFTMLRFVRNRSMPNAFAHAFVCAVAVGIRVAGFLLPAVTVVALGLQLMAERRDGASRRGSFTAAGIHAVAFAAFVMLFWPSMWDHPVEVLTRAFSSAVAPKQALQSAANHSTLYLGSFVEVTALPWHYLPVWIAISVPPLTLALFATGLAAGTRDLLARSWLEWDNIQTIVFLLLFFVPVAGVIVLRPALYDDWRHLYFVYPGFAAIAATGLYAVKRIAPAVAHAVGLLAIAHGAWVLVHLHPYQNVYFNVLAGSDVEGRFELDYWGLSYREGLEYVLAADPREKIPVAASDNPGVLNRNILPPAERSRLEYTTVDHADWFLSNHRQPKTYADFREKRFPYVNEAFAVRVDGQTLLGVYRLRPSPSPSPTP